MRWNWVNFYKYVILNILLVLLAVDFCYSQQNLSFNHIDVRHGLSQNSVLAITQDAEGFIWLGTRHGLNRFDTRKIKVFTHQQDDENSLSNDYIRALCSDHKGNLWVGTASGLNKYALKSGLINRFSARGESDSSISNNTVNVIFESRHGKIWVGTNNGLNVLADPERGKSIVLLRDHTIYSITESRNGILWVGTSEGLVSIDIEKGLKLTYHQQVNDLLKDTQENYISTISIRNEKELWIGTSKSGLILFQPADNIMRHFRAGGTETSLSSNNIRKILVDKSGILWIGTLQGLSIFDPGKNKFSVFRHDPDNVESLSQNSIYALFQDNHGSIWIGTYFGGCNILYPQHTPFEVFKHTKYRNSISSNIVSSICEDENANLWIGTEAEGVNLYNVKYRDFRYFKHSPTAPGSLSSNLVKAIYRDRKNNIWIGSHQGGLNKFISSSGTFQVYKKKSGNRESISSNNVNCLLQDSYNRFWVGTDDGLNLLDVEEGEFRLFGSDPGENELFDNLPIEAVFEDKGKNIWVGTVKGLYFLPNKSSKFSRIRKLDGININCISGGARGTIFIGTYHEGLFCFDPVKKGFIVYKTNDGLPSNNIVGIVEEKAGDLWISTDKGLSKWSSEQGIFRNFNTYDGLPGDVFNNNSFYRDKNGLIYFGGYNGLVSFRPSKFEVNRYSPPAVFTDIRVFNASVPEGSVKEIKGGKGVDKRLELTFDQRNFTIEFANLNYIKPENNAYSYKLEAMDKDWSYTENASVTYTNLNEGKYTLLVRGRNNDGIWSSQVSGLEVIILPPFWRTWWAYLIYSILIAGLLFMLFRLFLVRALLQKEKEVRNLQVLFFTNLSHEIRTPLTLILAPLERMILNSPENSALRNQLSLVKRNADRLMQLITELLDFRKIESGHEKLRVKEEEVVTFVRSVCQSFEDIASIRKTVFVFPSKDVSIPLYFDKKQLEKVLFNLLSNAFKFTSEGSRVEVEISESTATVELLVRDNGIGIPKEEQGKLFSTFYQVIRGNGQVGSGVGLALTKGIVQLHKGEISVESTPSTKDSPGFTCFRVNLRKGNDHFDQQDFASLENPSSAQTFETTLIADPRKEIEGINHKKTVLLVEDNQELRLFLYESLNLDYKLLQASDGLSGFDLATSQIPDLIISDIMMSGMDGLELTSRLKEDERTSHVPVILLTAKASEDHELAGLQTGADIYVAKPFSMRLLELHIRNLLAARETLKQRFSRVITLEPTFQEIEDRDQIFLNKIMNFIIAKLNNSELAVPLIASEMGMSQPVLYKKLRALTGLSVNDFIKSIRLKKAAQLLQNKNYSVAEIAYEVGFGDPKYFTKEFKKQFNKTPSEFSKTNVPD